MTTLRDLLLATVAALDLEERENCIRVWRFIDAPEKLQALSENAGGEDWLALVPNWIEPHYYILWLEQGCFGRCHVLKYPVANAMVYIGCHA